MNQILQKKTTVPISQQESSKTVLANQQSRLDYLVSKKKPIANQTDEEVKCRKCGEAVEEPAHIIRECEYFWQERLDEFNCLEWLPDMDWTTDQMMRFLMKEKVKRMEIEENQDD